MLVIIWFTLASICQQGIKALELVKCSDLKQKDQLCAKADNYDKTKVPGTIPTKLTPVMNIYDVTEVDEYKNSVTIYVQIIVKWIDERLSYELENNRARNRYVYLRRSFFNTKFQSF